MGNDGKVRSGRSLRPRERVKFMVALLSSTAVAVSPTVAMASGGIVADGRTNTSIVSSGNITDITTDTVRGGNAFNSFERFSVEQLQTVNLHQPEIAGALINVIRNGVTNIEGTLNTLQGGEIGGNVFMVSPDGLVVGAGGVINTGNLTVSTATHGFADRLIGPGGTIDDSAVAQLFAGGEPLSAYGAIELYGEINARRLELRAGARMLLDGRINVIDSTGTQTAAPAVNTDGAERASGVSVSGGVIRLHSGGDVRVSGQTTARSGDDGGRIAITAGGDIDVHAGADISADGVGDGQGGLVYLFADGSALLEEGARIGASAVAGDGGFIEFSARDRVSFGGTIDATSQEGRAGVVYIDPAEIVITTDIYTGGATWILEADERISVENDATISTRQVAGGAGGNQSEANSTGDSGDLIITAPEINLKPGAGLYAQGTGSHSGGLIALLARVEGDATSGLVAFDDSVARISITDATLHGGAIYIGAYAQAEGTIAPDSSASGKDGFLKAVLDVGLDLTAKLISGDGLETRDYIQAINDLAEPYGDKIPVQVAYLTADAEISITDSSLTADGNWSNVAPSNPFDTSATSLANNGVLTPEGLAESEYEFSADHDETGVESDGQPDSFTARLAHAFDTSGDAIYIHAHAQTDVNIEPGDDPLNLIVAITNTTSRVSIIDTEITSGSGDIVVNSTATENLSTSLDPKSYKDIAAGITISVRDLTNQALVNGGSIDADGDLTVQALTGLNHHITTEADAGKDGKFALATTVSIGNSLTEAALGGDLNAGGDLNLLAETLYFRKEHTTGATLGVDEPPKAEASEDDDADDANDDVFGFMNSFKDMILGQDDDGNTEEESGTTDPTPTEETSEPGFAGALAVDISIDENNTFASLGGQYHNIDSDRALIDLANTPVTAGDAINVNAVLRFAAENTDENDPSSGEGGQGLLRSVTSDVAELTDAMKAQLAEYNESADAENQKEEAEFIGDFGYGVFLNVPVASMTGVTQAELGGNLNVSDATSVNVQARTAYQNARPWEQSLSELLKDYIKQVASDFASPESASPETEANDAYDPENLPNPVEDPQQTLDDFFNLPDYLTTRVGAGAETPSEDEDSDQTLAIGVTVNYFSTSNETRAVVRDGAQINTSGKVDLSANAEGFFYHRANDLAFPELAGDEGANNAIGGAINVSRHVSTVEALVEGAAKITSDGLLIEAENDIYSLVTTFAGGNAEEVAINAAVGAIIMQNRTLAQLSDGATINLGAGALKLSALDKSAVANVSGAASVSGNVGVGASGTVNFLRRQTLALIGPEDVGTALASDAGHINAGSLSLEAENSGVQVALSIAGAAVMGETPSAPEAETPPTTEGSDSSDSSDSTPMGATSNSDDDDDMIIPSWLFDDEENEALDQQTNVSDLPSSDDGDSGSAGWAVSGSVALNLMLQNEVIAGVRSAGEIRLTKDLSIDAINSGLNLAIGGSVSAALSKQDNNAIAGAFAVTVDRRNTVAYLRNADVQADSIEVNADDASTVVSLAVGGAGTSKGDVALAGSVAVNVLLSGSVVDDEDDPRGTIAEISDSIVEAETIELNATDISTNVALGGAVGINLDKSGSAGVGLGISVNVFSRTTQALLLGDSEVTAGTLDISANMNAGVYGFAGSVGAGRTGLAGSVSVNTLFTGATAAITGEGDEELMTIRAEGVSVSAEEEAEIWSLAGAVAVSLGKAAVGGGVTVNVVSTATEAAIQYADIASRLDGDLGAVEVSAETKSEIGTLGAAGAAGVGNAVGLGLSGNAILADTIARLENSTVTDADTINVTAEGNRRIRSLGGAIAASSKNALGAALTVNVIDRNKTLSSLDGSTLSTRTDAITASAKAGGVIETAALSVGASGSNAVSGAATVNISTGETIARADGAELSAATDVVLSAKDDNLITSFALSVAASGSTAVGATVAVNVLSHDTHTLVTESDLTATTGDINLSAENAAEISTYAVGGGASGSNAVAGSFAIAYIGNSARVEANDVALVADQGEIDLEALKTSRIQAISGAAAGAGSNALGAAVTVAVIHDTVTADLATGHRVAAGSLVINATNSGQIDAFAAGGAAAGTTGIAGSFVYTQIGKPPSEAAGSPRIDGLEAGEEDPIATAEQDTAKRRDEAFDNAISESTLFFERVGSGDSSTPTFDLMQEDITRASLTVVGTGQLDVGSILVQATEAAVGEGFDYENADSESDNISEPPEANIRSLAGAIGAGGSAGIGAAFTVNLLFGQTIAEVVLPTGANVELEGDLTINAQQHGIIQTMAASAGVGGSGGVGGSVTVNVMQRDIRARLLSDDPDAAARLTTEGGDVTVDLQQSGRIQSLAGAIGGGGSAGIGVAVGVNVLADKAIAEIRNISVDTSSKPDDIDDPEERGNVAVQARQDIRLDGVGVSIGAGGSVGVGGSFAFNVNDSSIAARLYRSEITSNALSLIANSDAGVFSLAGAFAGAGAAAVGLGVAVNVSAMDVLADVDGSRVRALGTVKIDAEADTQLSGNAVSGAISGTVSVTGSVATNVAENTVRALVRNTGDELTIPDPDMAGEVIELGGSDIVTQGTVLMRAAGQNSIKLATIDDDDDNETGTERGSNAEDGSTVPTMNVTFSVGGTAAVGVAVSVNKTSNEVEAAVTDLARIVGLGFETAESAKLGEVNGVAIEAYADTVITTVTANASAGLYAGVAGLFAFNIVDDAALVNIGDGTEAGAAIINALVFDDALFAESGEEEIIEPDANQNTYLVSAATGNAQQYNVALGIGAAGVGAAAGTTLFSSAARTTVDRGSVFAANKIEIDASVDANLTNVVIGAAGGVAGVAGSVGVNIFDTNALVSLQGAQVTAGRWVGGTLMGGAVSINASTDNTVLAVTGAGAAGGTAVAGAFQVNVFSSSAKVDIGGYTDAASSGVFEENDQGDLVLVGDPVTVDDNSIIRAGGDVTVEATTTMDTTTFAGGGAIGTGGGAVTASVNVNLVEAETMIRIGDLQTVEAGNDLSLAAREKVELEGIIGVVSADVNAGIGAAVDYAAFSSRTQVNIGTGSRLTAGRNLALTADADRLLDSLTIVGAVGGAVGVSAAIGVIAMGGEIDITDADGKNTQVSVQGGSEEEQDADSRFRDLLGSVQEDLDSDQAPESRALTDDERSDPDFSDDGDLDTSRSSADQVAVYGGGGDIRGELIARRQAINVVDAPAGDDVGISIGNAVTLRAGNDLTLESDAKVSARQFGGAAAGGGIAGIGAGVLISTVGVASTIDIGAHSRLHSGRNIGISAQTGPGSTGSTLESNAFTMGLGVGVGVSAAVVVSRATTVAGVTVNEGVRMEGLNPGERVNALDISAQRNDVLSADVLNIAVGGVAGVGVVVVDSTLAGRTGVELLGRSSTDRIWLRADALTVDVSDKSRANVEGQGAAGGIFGGLNATIVTARNQGRNILTFDNVTVRGGNAALNSVSEAEVTADAWGLAVSAGVSVGASVARAYFQSDMTTSITDVSFVSDNIAINTELRTTGSRNNAAAYSESTSGGLLAGNGAEATTLIDYTLATNLSGEFDAELGRIDITTSSAQSRAIANATGAAGGVVALGVVLAEVGQSEDKTSRVSTAILEGFLLSDDIVIRNTSGSRLGLETIAGSGGLVAGSASEGLIRGLTDSLMDIGTQGEVGIIARNILDIGAGHSATIESRMDNFNATLVGVSGVNAQTTYTSDVETRIRGGVQILANQLEMLSSNTIRRALPTVGHNIKSGSGGALDIPAMISDVTVNGASVLTLDDGVEIAQLSFNPLNDPESFRMGAVSTIDLTDRLLLDAGGAIAIPIGRSSVVANDDTVVNVGAVDIFTEGDLRFYSGSNVDIHAEVDANSYGLAGAATGGTDAVYRGVSNINIGAGAELESLSNVRLTAGLTGSGPQNINVRAETRVFNKTAIPIPTDPRADAVGDTHTQVKIDDGARVRAVQDVYLYAMGGHREIVGYGRGKDLYRQVLEEIANAVGEMFGADEVSLDIKSGTSTDFTTSQVRNVVTVDGYVRAGSRNSQQLLFIQSVDQELAEIFGYESGDLDAWVDDNLHVWLDYRTLFTDAYGTENNFETEAQYFNWLRGDYTPDNLPDFETFIETNDWRWVDIDWTLRRDVSVAQQIQDRIDELQVLLDNPVQNGGNRWDNAVTAWEAEIARLEAELFQVGDATVDLFEIGPIVANGGNIYIRSDYVHGNETGVLEAPADALVEVLVTSPAFASLDTLTIPARSGGQIVFNEVPVPAELQGPAGAEWFRARTYGGTGQTNLHQFSTVHGVGDPETGPLISVQNTAVVDGVGGNIILNGDVENLLGTLSVITNDGDVDVRADISALTVIMEATNGNFIQGYTPGITNTGGTPIASRWIEDRDNPDDPDGTRPVLQLHGQYGNYFTAVKDFYTNIVRTGPERFTIEASDQTGVIPPFSLLDSIDRITAGKNVFITADVLNINGLIQAGRGRYDVLIEAGVDNEIEALRGTASGTILFHNPAERVAGDGGDIERSDFIDSDVAVYYNFDEDRFEIRRMIVQGGQVELVGDIISTGNGRIEALDGFGEIHITSESALPIAVNRLDTGSGVGLDGVAGIVRITDTAFQLEIDDRPILQDRDGRRFVLEGGNYFEVTFISDEENQLSAPVRAGEATAMDDIAFYTSPDGNMLRPAYRTTQYSRLDDALWVNDNRVMRAEPRFDPASWDDKGGENPMPMRLVPDYQVGAPVSGAGSRQAVYQPKKDRDLIFVLAEEWVTTTYYLDDELVIIGIRGVKRETTTTAVRRDPPVTTPLNGGAYVGAALTDKYVGGEHYDYHFTGEQIFNRTTGKLNYRQTHNSVRWYKLGSGHIHHEYHRINTTRQLYEHRLNASHPIDIVFAGGSEGQLNINAVGDVIFLDTVVNRVGNANITSQQGSILTADFDVILNTAALNLSAGQGPSATGGMIGGLAGEFRVNQEPGAPLTAIARDNIVVREMSGDMNIVSARVTDSSSGELFGAASSGNVHLIADRSILHYDDDTSNTVRGANVTLEAQSGQIGEGRDDPLRVETEGGRLNARAAGDIAITEMEGNDGDLRVELVQAGGSVTLIANYGSILDRNEAEERDIRTEAELMALYFEELGLDEDESGARAQAQIEGLRERRQREYLEYWQLRTGDEGLFATDTTGITEAEVRAMAEDMFSGLDVVYRESYGWTDAVAQDAAQQFIDSFVDERWGLYQQWNAAAQFDKGFTYNLTAEEFEPFLEGMSWTEEELTTSISAGLVRQTGDTRIRNQAPNIIAQSDITLIARDSVGELLDDYEIHPIDPTAENFEYHLSADDLMALARADRLDLFDADGNFREDDEGRITYSEDGIIRIAQREDFNVEFTGPNGALTVTTDEHEIFLGSDADVRIRQVHGTNDVQILIDGAMTDVSGYDPTSGTTGAGDVAVIGTNLVLESGINNSIGSAQTPLSVHILAGGSLNARAGTPGHQNVYITAFGDLPVEALFAGDTASLHATGAITDNVGSDLPRVVASNIYLKAAQIGSDDNLFGIEQIDEEDGRVTLETFADGAYDGDVYLDVKSELNLFFGRIDQGGLINARKGITFFGTLADGGTLSFGDTAALEIRTAQGIDTQFSTGTDITGNDLLVNTGGQVGDADHRLLTAIDLFNYYGDHFEGNEEITALWMRNLRSIEIGEIIQNANALSETDVETVGDMTLGLAQSLSRTRLQAEPNAGEGSVGNITRGTVIAEETELLADGGIGTDTRFEAVTGLFRAEAGTGDATLLLRDREVDIDHIALMGGALDLLTRDAPVRLLEEGAEWSFAWTDEGAGLGSGRGISTLGGDLVFHLVNSDPTTTRTALSLGAFIDTSVLGAGLGAGGNIGILVEGSADQDDGQRIISGEGTTAMEVEDDFTLASIWTENATDNALRLTVGGTLFNTGRLADLDLLANASGALTTLQLGALDPAGNDDPDLADGLRTDLDRLDAVVQAGDMHLNDVGRLTLESVFVQDGNIDVFAGSDSTHDMLVNLVEAPQEDATVVLSVLGDLRSGVDTWITGDNLALFSFMGNITGEGAGAQLGSGGFFEATTSAGAELRMMAGQNLRYRERADDLQVLFMFAGTKDGSTGHMEVEVEDGSLAVGMMGAAEDVRIEAQGAIDINLAGNTEFDIIDAGPPLNLVRSEYYDDVYQAHAPGTATLTAWGQGSSIDVGLINLRDRLQLYAYEHIDARAYDVDPDNGLLLETSNPEGGFVGSEDIPLYIRVIGDGPRILLDDPYDDFQHLIDDRLEADGTLWLENSRIGWGEVVHAGPYFVGLNNNRIDGDVYFRQRTFDLYAHILYRFLDVDADAQIYAFENEGRVGFTTENEIILTTAEDVLVLNRKLAGVDLDGGQGFTYDVGSETETLGGTFIRGTAPGGVVRQIFQVMELFDEDEEELTEGSEEGNGAGEGSPPEISPELATHLQASVN